jgi:four helix bundle protein
MGPRKFYRDLIVWQKAMALARQVYEYTRCFPREEMYGLTSQVRRAVVSIPANIAEGQARGSQAEFARFLGIAKGSHAELETLLLLAQELGYGTTEVLDRLLEFCAEVGRLLSGLKSSLKKD